MVLPVHVTTCIITIIKMSQLVQSNIRCINSVKRIGIEHRIGSALFPSFAAPVRGYSLLLCCYFVQPFLQYYSLFLRRPGEPRPWASWPPCQCSSYPFPLYFPLFSLIFTDMASPCLALYSPRNRLGGWKGVDRFASPCRLKNIDIILNILPQ
jgi:hypothetical protein